MYFLAINKVKQGADTGELMAIIPQHVRWTMEQIGKGVVAQAGKWGEYGGMILFSAEDAESARNFLNGDPLINSGLVDVEMERLYPDVQIKQV